MRYSVDNKVLTLMQGLSERVKKEYSVNKLRMWKRTLLKQEIGYFDVVSNIFCRLCL